MKKIMIMFVLGALAFTVQAGGTAGIVNGDFSLTPPGQIASSALSGNPISVVLDKGWYTNYPSSQNITIDGGVATRPHVGPASWGSVAQFFTSTNNGPTALNFDVQCTDANANLTFQVILFGYTLKTSTHAIGSSDAARLQTISTTLPANGVNYDVTQLVNYTYTSGTLNGGAFTTISTNFTASTSYEFYGTRIIANHPDSGDVLVFDNVSVGAPSGPAPKPATMFIVQ